MQDGALVELSAGSNGGQNYADGWWEGKEALARVGRERRHDSNMCDSGVGEAGKQGIFPSNYVSVFVTFL